MASADRFKRYEEKRKQSEPPGFLRRAANFMSGAALFGIGAAAVIGGGATAYKAIGEEKILSGIGKAMGTITRGTDFISGLSSGFFRTAKSAGWKNIIAGKASNELAENLGETLRPYVSGRMNKALGGGSAFRTENLLNALRQRYKEAPKFAADDIRAEVIRKKIKETEGITEKMSEDLEQFLNPDSNVFKLKWQEPLELNKRKFEDIILERVKSASKGYLGEEKTIIDTAILNLRKGLIETSNYTEFTKKYATEIQTQAKVARDKFIETTIDAAKKTYGGKDVPFAEQLARKKDPLLRRATYGDLKNVNLLKKRQMDKGTAASFYQKIIEEIPELKGKIDDLILDPSLFIGRQGQLIDVRGIVRTADRATDILAREFQVPFVGIRPFNLLRPIIPNDKNEFMQYVFEKGQKSNIGKAFGETTKRTVYFGGKLFDTSGNVLDENLYLTRFGSHKRALMQMDEASRHEELIKQLKDDKSFTASMRKLYDIGLQENRGIVGDFASWFTKFGDTLWGPNIVKGIQSQGEFFRLDVYLDAVRSKTKRIADIVSRPLGREELTSAQDAIVNAFGQNFFDVITTGSTESSVINGMRFAVQDEKISKLLGNKKIKSFQSIISRVDKDPELFYRIKSATSDNIESAWDNVFASFNISGSRPMKYGDLFSKELHSIIYENIIPSSKSSYENIDEAIRGTFKGLEEKQYKKILDLDLFNRFNNIKPDDKMGLGDMAQLIGGYGNNSDWYEPLTKRVQSLYKKADPSWGFGPKPQPVSIIGSETPVIIRQSKIGNTFLEGINNSIKNGTFDVKDFFGTIGATSKQAFRESGFGPNRAGRGKLDEVTDFTTGVYNTFSRLNQGLEMASVGLSKQYTGSSQDLAKNLFLRRLLLPVVTIGYLSYLNDQIGNFTGEEPSDLAVKGFASASLGVQKAKDLLGINALGQRIEQILPGSEHLWESPLLTPIRIASLGAVGDNRGYDELLYYLTEGDQPIRKGRWWSFGSNTPWYGGRVSGHHPSYYRRMLGEPTMTDSLWGSEREYWSNNWLPTPHNPLGPIKTWILDPYHWERKNADNRPTAVYGGIPELESIPVVGPLTDATIGRIFKPIRRNPKLAKAHREYITEINEGIKQALEGQSSGGLIYITPGGRMTPKEVGPNFAAAGYGGEGDGSQISEGNYPVSPYGGGGSGGIQTTYGIPGYGAASARDQLTGINASIKNLPDLDTRSIRGLEDSRLADSLTEFADPNSVSYRMNESFYNVREIMGLRGFAIEALFGDVGKPSMMLQSSSRSYGYERRFWDQEMGGRTGDLSEIVRRFIPHRRRDIQEYNPIRNQMGDWLPSNQDYFMDFLHGDPYLTVTMGEARLPGEGYEAINKLHPDQYFGRYGALDRMKILGDVAPWSPQYSYYSKVVTQMYQSGLYSDKEYDIARRTREQVSQRKKKYEFFNYKFRDSSLTERTVTVSRMIDPYTFMTEELGAVPIKLAGIKGPRSRTTEEGEAVSNLSATMLGAGSKVKIAYSNDPLKVIKGDVMNSINAVVWSNGKKVQQELINSGYVKADYESTDPAAVNALYSGFERTAGKIWETVTHTDNPLSTKFLQTRSPLEMYERNIIYGKEFQSWETPIKSWIVPTLNKAAARSPAISMAGGALLGSFFGRSPEAKVVAAVIVGTASFLPSAGRTIKEFAGKIYDDQYTWIPKEERKVREVEEYFDKLKYVKYKGLYEKAKRSAKLYEGVDIDELLSTIEDESGLNTAEARKLKRIKSTIKSTMGDSIVDTDEAQQRVDAINDRLAEISGKKKGVLLGPIAMQALQYKKEYESTLYGADPYGDLLNIYQALPKRERAFFQEFLKAKPKERERILRLVPKNQRRFYQAKWGLSIDRKESLTEYFASHYLPGSDWKGWMPEQSLEETKLKFVENKALDISDFGFWETDLAEIGAGTPSISKMEAPVYTLDLIKLKAVLEGKGLSDVDIFISKEQTRDPNTSFEMNLDIKHNRQKEVATLFNQNATSLLG